MDSIVEWKVNDKVDTLVAAITKCKQELVTGAFKKYGMHTKLLTCDVFVGPKPIDLLRLSKPWKPLSEIADPELKVPLSRRQKKTTELVGDISGLNIHRMDVLGEDAIRVVATFEVKGDSAEQMWFGNVLLVP